MRILLLLLALAAVQAPPPSSEIYLVTLSADDDGLVLGKPENISNSAGYDNQPFFTPDGSAILFASGRRRGGAAFRPPVASRRRPRPTSTAMTSRPGRSGRSPIR
jgi:Tol biopolymer transport system component